MLPYVCARDFYIYPYRSKSKKKKKIWLHREDDGILVENGYSLVLWLDDTCTRRHLYTISVICYIKFTDSRINFKTDFGVTRRVLDLLCVYVKILHMMLNDI